MVTTLPSNGASAALGALNLRGTANAPIVHPGHHSDAKQQQDADYAVVKLYPTQMRFVTGIARAYDDDFPPELSPLVPRLYIARAVD